MCYLRAVNDVADQIVPDAWRVGVFGSATRCPGNGTCMAGASDVDLIVVHPAGEERAALDVRRVLVARVGDLGVVADVTLLSEREVISTGFWSDENAVDLVAVIVVCDRTDSGL